MNPDLIKGPSLLRRDAYGKGWLLTLHVDDAISPWRNLLPVNLVKSWMEDAVSRLSAKQPSLAGARRSPQTAQGGLTCCFAGRGLVQDHRGVFPFVMSMECVRMRPAE